MNRCIRPVTFALALLLVLSNMAMAQTPSPVSFLAARSYDVGQSPYAVVMADFNGDGKLDMAVPGNTGVGGLTVFLGDGAGNFTTSKTSASGVNNPGAVAVGDFNGDGKPDIAVSGWVGSDTVCVLLGHGDGTFQSPLCYSTVARPFGVAAGDFNGDGKADLVLSSPDNGNLSVLLGNGDGTFQPAVNYASGVRAYFVAVGDFNGDGKLDVVATDNDSPGRVNVLLGNGDGTFQPPMHNTVGNNPLGFVVADFNGDGRLDVAVGNYFDNNVSILLGNGDGTFQPAVNYNAGKGPFWVSTGDFDGDGKLDLAVADYAGETVSVLRGNGDGTFSTPVRYGAGSSLSAVAAGDFDGDGRPELAVTNSWDAAVYVLHNNGDGTFVAAPTYLAGSQPFSVAAGDFNHDGKIDLVSANRSSNSVSVLLGNGNGTLQGKVDYAVGSSPYFVLSGDLNKDGIPDLAVANNGSNNISVLLGNGNGTFQPATNYAVGSLPYAIAMGDFNQDGNMDLVVANQSDNTVSVLLGSGGGTFLPAVVYAVSYIPVSIAVGDFNNDGNLDLAVANLAGNSISILLGKGDGTFGGSTEYDLGVTPYTVVVADLNGDGTLDLATANYGDNSVMVLFGNGDGSFGAPHRYAVDNYPYGLVALDLNGDGSPDLAVANSTSGSLSLLLNNGDGTFQPAVNFGTGSTPVSIAAADFDGDGRPDLAVANACFNDPRCTGGNVAILLNRSVGFAQAVMTSPPSYSTFSGATVTFVWTKGNGATGYRLDAGSTPGGTQYFQSGNLGNVSTVTVNSLPLDGSKVYVTLWSLVNGSWLNNQYTYTAHDQANDRAVLTSPPPGSNLPGAVVPFAWTPGTGVTAYMLDAGSTPGANDYFWSGNLGNALGVVAYNLPLDGSTVYVTLYSFIGGQWYSNAYTYHAYQPTKGFLVSPPPGSQLTNTTVTFNWNPGDGMAFSLDVGSTPGGNDYDHLDLGFSLSATVNNLPSDGSTVYVTLYSLISGQFYSNSYTYTAFNVNNAKGVLTVPPPGSRLHGSTVTFGWLAGSGSTFYQLNVGSTPGGTDYYQSGDLGNVLTTTVSGLPTDGSTVYVTLFSKVFGQWLSSPYTYRAYGTNIPPITFLPSVSYNAQAGPVSVALADVNGDHRLDLVVGNFYGDPNCQCTGSVSVMLGNADGTFQAANSYATGQNTYGVAVGDFNNDGKPDVVAANYGESSVSVLLGNGNGTLQPAASYPTGANPASVAVGDFDGDGKLDLVTANTGDNTITVLKGNGNGTFGPPVLYSVGQFPNSVAVGDVNRDGKLDLVVANEADGTFTVLLGNGDGSFRQPLSYAGPVYPFAVALADWDGDGKLDLVMSDSGSQSVNVMLGKGDGTFKNPIAYPAGWQPTGVTVGDFNGDGSPDFAAADGGGGGEVSVYAANGDGTFGPQLQFLGGGQCSYGIAAGDLDGDGRADLAVADFCDNTVNILLTGIAPAQITSPPPGSTLTGSSVTFQWTSSPSATAYSLVVGNTPGGHQYFSSGNLPTNTQSANVTTLPTDGSTVYVTLSSLIGGQWIAKSYTYTAYNLANAKGVLTTPTPGTILTDSTVYFGWTAGQSATSYRLDAGSTPGGTQYFQSPNLGNVLNALVTTLPVDGSTVYVTLWSMVNGQWLSNQYTYTAFNQEAAKAVLNMPPPGSTLAGNTVTFGWNAGAGATGFRLDVGSVPLGTQYFTSGNLGLVPTVTVNTIPVDGSTVYVTLWTLVNGTWLNNQYTYTASSVLGIITSPGPGAQFPGTTVTFTWDPGTAATAYRLDAGKTPGGRQYFSSQNLGNVLTVTVTGLPSDSSTVYVTLWSLVGGKWLSNSYTYMAWDGALGQAILTSPPPGSEFTGTTVTFGWTPGTGANGYRLYVGSTPGGSDYYSSHVLNTLNVTVNNLPSDTSLVYVTLFTRIGGIWYSRTYTYTAWNAAAAIAVMFVPAPGAQFGGTAVTFAWGAGTGATAYKLDIGKTPGGHQYFQSGSINVLTATVSGLPADGSAVYVTLYTQINGQWYSNPYTYTAWNVATAQAVMVSPLGGSQFSGTTVTFVWTAGIGATAYRLDVGKAPGAHQYYQSASLNVLTTTVSRLPNDGSNVYVTLYTQINGVWYTANYVYVAFKPKAITFRPAVSYPAGASPHAIAVGDFNHDGKLDLAVADRNDNNVGIMLGQGDGTFRPAVIYSAGTTTWSIVVGDFNGDGKLDIATANAGSKNVSVLLGNGDGTFRTAVNYTTGTSPYEVIVADFNGDGKLDMATANQGSNNVSVLLGNGDGTFKPAVNYPVGQQPWSVNVADFNGDGKLDIVAVSDVPDKTAVLMGNGDGTFQPAVNYNVGSGPSSVAVGDLTGDGKPDLVVANQSSDNVSVLLNKGDGTFAKAVSYTTAAGSRCVVLADFNGDGTLDAAVTNRDNNSVSILAGDGDGTFQATVTSVLSGAPYIAAVGDFNGDGKLDIAIPIQPATGKGSVLILLNSTP